MDKRLEKVIRQAFNLDSGTIQENWTSNDIAEWDSLGHLILIAAVEKEFNIKFDIEEMFQVKSLGDISRILREKRAII